MRSCGNTSSQETKQRFKVNLTYTLWLFGLLAGDRSATGNIEQVASSRPSRVASASPCREKLKAQQTVQSDDDARRHLKTTKAHSPCCQKSTSRPQCAIDSVFHVKQVVFFLSRPLLRSPLVTWLAFVSHYLSAVIHLQRTESPLYKVEEGAQVTEAERFLLSPLTRKEN